MIHPDNERRTAERMDPRKTIELNASPRVARLAARRDRRPDRRGGHRGGQRVVPRRGVTRAVATSAHEDDRSLRAPWDDAGASTPSLDGINRQLDPRLIYDRVLRVDRVIRGRVRP